MTRSTIANLELAPGIIRTPFTILIDKAEKHPWTFDGLSARSFIDKEMREYSVKTEASYLGIGRGDYSIAGFQDKVAIERKSMRDFQGTLLGWPHDISNPEECYQWDTRKSLHRRGRFKNELRTLQSLECRAVIVEASLEDCIANCEQWGKRTANENAKYLHSTFISWTQQFRVPFYFGDRRFAEVTAFRIFEQFWDRHRTEFRKRQQERRQEQRQLTAITI
ncbi:PDDEXK family nuclease [Trichococcus shcherbakoviae]|uniref:hypothetical protein n=1 Tax=Trichococcus shcherbakoviae TaxID=2094020 RepID=UPI002AA64EC1|nr:hypothetical protein [Trichococcus shcherbakoviae]